MYKKMKRLPILLTAVLTLSLARQAPIPAETAAAKSSIHFYAGDAAIDKFNDREPLKISSVKVPEGCSTAIYTSDKNQADGTLTSADAKTAAITQLHQGAGWYVEGKKTGKTTLNYKHGSDKGSIEAEILPKLKLKALKKSAKVSGGKIKLTVKYKNTSDTDVVIEGVDIGMAQIQFDGDAVSSEESVIPTRWIAKNVTIPAGKTKSFSVTESAAKAGRIKKFSYPGLYFKYQDAYFSSVANDSGVKGYIEYHGAMSFQDFV